ncbi:hypothetical protein K1719_012272 [Acacia pycnantha]|nr:hypothetical protein K1719_012272 [Acacia pycnantha]
MIGKMIKVDRSTSIYDKGGFARICVEIDLKKPLLPTYLVFGEERPIIYEGLHSVCLSCGKYGHQQSGCPLNRPPVVTQGSDQGKKDEGGREGVDNSGESKKHEHVTGTGNETERKEGEVGGATAETQPRTVTRADGELPKGSGNDAPNENHFGKIRLLRREVRGYSISDKSGKGVNGVKDVTKFIEPTVANVKPTDNEHDKRRISGKKEDSVGLTENKKELLQNKSPIKSEWVQIGSKRKNISKGKSKGKENKSPANRIPKSIIVGHGVESFIPNSFSALQGLEEQINCGSSSTTGTLTAGHASDQEMIGGFNKLILKIPASHPIALGNPVDISFQGQKKDLTNQEAMDDIMCDQDKALGEVAIPQIYSTVSQ